jgi:hypothetical protein
MATHLCIQINNGGIGTPWPTNMGKGNANLGRRKQSCVRQSERVAAFIPGKIGTDTSP